MLLQDVEERNQACPLPLSTDGPVRGSFRSHSAGVAPVLGGHPVPAMLRFSAAGLLQQDDSAHLGS